MTGASTTPRATTLVSSSRLIPPGWNSHVEYRTWWPWVRAKAGQRKNQMKRAASPQPQVVVDVGCDDHTPHHSATRQHQVADRRPAEPGRHRHRSTGIRPPAADRAGPVHDDTHRRAAPGPQSCARGHDRVGAVLHGGERRGCCRSWPPAPRSRQGRGDGVQVGAPAGRSPCAAPAAATEASRRAAGRRSSSRARRSGPASTTDRSASRGRAGRGGPRWCGCRSGWPASRSRRRRRRDRPGSRSPRWPGG